MMTMSESHLRFRFLSLLLLCCVSSSSNDFNLKNTVVGLGTCHPLQIEAFTQFKNEFDTRHCNHSDSFNGVWCDNSTGAVMKLQLRACLSGILKSNSRLFEFHKLRYLDLSHNNFNNSSLPSKFGHLNKLEVLFLFSNGFIGQVPSSVSNLSLLTYLDLSENQLTGRFPHLRNLTKLISLDLSANHFSGTLNPNSSLFELHQLRHLILAYNNFSSSLPFELGNLHRLEKFYLTVNGFFGQVPPTISNLTQLNELSFDVSMLTGSFPLVQNLTKLSILGLSHNNFTGPIPSSLFTMPFLSYLDLSENHLTGSALVPNSSASSTLELLYLGNNLFEGQILEPISKLITLKQLDLSFLNINHPIDLRLFSSLKSLSYLDLSSNSISPTSLSSDSYIVLTLRTLSLILCDISEFPNILKTLENLEYLFISNNKIKGKVPEWLWKLPCLKMLDISYNSFNGFEGSVEALVNSSVERLLLDSNHFKGRLPHLPISIKLLSASANSFTGEIPLSICNKSSFSVLNLSDNNFTGPIPQCLTIFKIVDLGKNNLQGSIPDKFYAETTLETLNLDYNRLSGKLPKSLVNCSSLQLLTLENNRIRDTFPFWLKVLPNMQVLILRSNQLYGPISPPHQGPLGFPELRILEISDNEFTGSLPPNYFIDWKISSSLKMKDDEGLYMLYKENNYNSFYYTYTDHIDLQYKGLNIEHANVLTFYSAIGFSGNKLEGHIPESIGLLKALIALNLSNNAFTGQIPLSLANLKELESLDLSRNQLSGTIPSGLGTLSFLAYVNVSHNQLKGEIPQGTQIVGQPKSSFEGNSELCGLPLEKKCFAGNESPPTQQHVEEEEEEEEEEMVNWKAVVVGYGSGLILGMSIAQVIVFYKPEWLVKIIGPTKRRNR